VLTCPSCGRESPDDFAFCPACAAPLAAPIGTTESRKTVTIVFCDVSGSTALGERLDPESLRDVQTRYFDAMRAAIEKHGGTVEKYIGDAVMAVFGIPLLHEDDALRAARAAADMREALATLNERLERDRGVTLAVRIGVNTGEVVAGTPAGTPTDIPVGGSTSSRALVTGDAVNVAARLEQLAGSGDILLGEATHRLVRDAVEAEPAEPLTMKGKAAPVAAWRLVAVRDVTSAIPRSGRSPMVGRARQLAQLRQAFDAVVEDRACQLVTVFGSAGVGKSRLVDEFLDTVEGATTVLSGRCLPYGEGITYQPVVETIKQAAGLADFDPPEVVSSKVCAVLEADEHRELVCGRVSQLMGIAASGDADETLWAIRRFYEAVARERPLVLVLDDLQWGEPAFLDLLDQLAEWSSGSPILLLCMARPELLELRPEWGGGKLRAAAVALEPLSEAQTADLIANLVGSADVPPGLTAAVAERAEGNPLFVEETIAMLIDEGRLVRDGDRWRSASDSTGDSTDGSAGDSADGSPALAVPPSIQALLAARLDLLAPRERGALEAASVIGRDLFVGAVQALTPTDERGRVPGELLGLVRKELIRPIPSTLPGEDAFRFRHQLILDAAYDAIPKARRAELHERYADWLEAVAGDAVGEEEEILGYHLERAHAYRSELGPADDRSAELGRRAAVRLAAAGRRAAARGDQAGAVALLSRAASLGPPDGADRAWTLYHLGTEQEEAGEERAAIAALEEAVRIATSSDDPALAWRARIALTEMRGEVDPASVTVVDAEVEIHASIEAFEAIGDEAGLADAWTRLGFLSFAPCRYDDAASAEGRAVAHARACGDDRLLFLALRLQMVSEIYGTVGPEEALERINALREDVRRSRPITAVALAVRSCHESMLGDIDAARRTNELAADLLATLGMRFFVAICSGFRADIERRADELVEAESFARRSYELLAEGGSTGIMTTHAAALAIDVAELGRPDEAERLAAVARGAGSEDVPSQAGARAAEALASMRRGNLDRAESRIREALAMLEGAQWPEGEGDYRMILARVLRAGGRPAEAEAAARDALRAYELKGVRPSIGATRSFLAELGGRG